MPEELINADVIISGAGPAGLTLSLLLARAGFSVVLIDPEIPKTDDKPSGRTAALLNSSINVLKTAGIWEKVQSIGTPLKIMKIIDDSAGLENQITVAFEASDVGFEAFGYNIPNSLLKKALLENVKTTKNLTHLCPQKLVSYEINGTYVKARTENGQKIMASVIIGTDGRNSLVRKVADIDCTIRDYGQIAMTCLISHTKPHNFTSTELHRSGGPFTFVPMPQNQSSVVWVEKTEDAKKYLAMKKPEYERAIQDRTCGFLGTVKLESNPESWPLMYLDAKGLIGERSALAAEAAHVMSPIGAQGLNLSLRDVATLAEVLTDAARLGEDIGSKSVLARYERRRMVDIKSHVTGIDGLNRAVANDKGFVNDLRRLGLKGLQNVPALKNFAMTQGLVPSMDEGRILTSATL